MNADLERDLAAFERMELSREQLLALHAEAEPLIRLHDRMMVAATASPAPDPEAGWAALMEKMDSPAPVVPMRRSGRARRTTVLAVAAALMLAGSAFAAVGPRVLRERHTITPSPAPIVAPVSPESDASPEAPDPSDEPTVSPTPDTSGGQGDNHQGGNQGPSSSPAPTQSGDGDSQGQDQSGDGDSQGQDQGGGGDSQGGGRTTSGGGDQGSQDSQAAPSGDDGDSSGQGSQGGQG